MELNELIERLSELRDELGGEVEVRLMSQPNWPFENSILGLTTTAEMDRADAEEEADGEDAEEVETDPDCNVVYIVEGSQLGYGRKTAWSATNG